jgi:hypothetical protein
MNLAYRCARQELSCMSAPTLDLDDGLDCGYFLIEQFFSGGYASESPEASSPEKLVVELLMCIWRPCSNPA